MVTSPGVRHDRKGMFNEKEKCTFIFSIKTKKPIPANYEMQ